MTGKRRRYGRAWKRIRDRYAAKHPNCERCGAPTEEIHHITPLCEGGGYDDTNLMALCRRCHKWIHERAKDCQYLASLIPGLDAEPELKEELLKDAKELEEKFLKGEG